MCVFLIKITANSLKLQNKEVKILITEVNMTETPSFFCVGNNGLLKEHSQFIKGFGE